MAAIDRHLDTNRKLIKRMVEGRNCVICVHFKNCVLGIGS
jgi:hypothetical protein